MKTERRHELQTNDLANWLGGQVQDLKPYVPTIVGVTVLLAAGSILLLIMSNRNTRQRATSWKDYYAAAIQRDVTQLIDISEKYPGTSASAWAMQSAGDISLADGTNMQHRDRQGAMKKYELAKVSFENAFELADNDLLRQRSLLGLGQACEALNDFEGAKRQYEKVVEEWPDDSVAKLATRKIAFLERPDSREFYDWYLRQQPYTPAAQPGGGFSSPGPEGSSTNPFGSISAPEGSSFPGGLGDNTPDTPAEVSTEDALDLGDALDLNGATPITDTPAPTTEDALPITDTPAVTTDDALPITEQPATEEPATEQPATEQPATEEPATEEPGEPINDALPSTTEPVEPKP